jgi:hypothetical protein
MKTGASGFILALLFAFSHTPLALAASSACIPLSYFTGALSNAQNSLNNTLQANTNIYQRGVNDLNTQQQQYLNIWQKQEDTALHAGEVLSFDAVRLYYSQMLADEQATYNNSLSQLQTTKSNADLSAQNQFSRDKSAIEYNQAFATEWCAVQSLQYCKDTYGTMATANADGSCTVSCPSDYAYASSTKACNPITIPVVPSSATTTPPPITVPAVPPTTTTATPPIKVTPAIVQSSHAPIKVKSVPVAPAREAISTTTSTSASMSPVIAPTNPPQTSLWAWIVRVLNPFSWF